jgi:peptide/nickel transport system permease protein
MKRAALYLLRRVGWTFVLMVSIATLAFFLSNVLPGDATRMLLGPQASAKDVERARALYGLDRPILEQYVRHLKRLVHRGAPNVGPESRQEHRSCERLGLGLHIDLGYSFHYRRPVTKLLAAKLPRSIELGLAALLVQLAIGVSAGVFAAARRGSRWAEATMSVSLLAMSIPTFLLGLVLQYILSYQLRLLPYDGYGATGAEHLMSLVLPALTLGVFGSAVYARIVRDEVDGLLRQDFIRTARAKGASDWRILVVHALRNALVPLVTMVALDLGTLIGGAIVTEKLFRWPGVGQLAVEALLNRDGPVIFGTVLLASAAVLLSTLAADLVYVALDPRLRRA